MVSVDTGIVTTIAIIAHEIPQEIGDFSLLVYSGMTKTKALFFNLLSALLSILGGLSFFYFSTFVSNLEAVGLAFTGGTLLYIAGSDLVPELLHNSHHEKDGWKKELLQLCSILFGIGIIYLVISLHLGSG